MVKLLQQFIIIAIILFSVNMIYFYFRNKSKKYKNIPTIEMNYLIRIYGIDILKLGIKTVEKHISIINSVIVSADLLIYYNIENTILKLFIVFITTLVLVFVFYNALGIRYRKMLYRWGEIWRRYFGLLH